MQAVPLSRHIAAPTYTKQRCRPIVVGECTSSGACYRPLLRRTLLSSGGYCIIRHSLRYSLISNTVVQGTEGLMELLFKQPKQNFPLRYFYGEIG